ncbi:MAG: hypothetical protein K1X92_15200 [Bacteroidia bacterium]|nr:hypothetical protein [Bacteroidia bacterium]
MSDSYDIARKLSFRWMILFIFVSVFMIWGCKETVKPRWQTIAIRNLYTIDLPGSLKPTNEMHEGAALQYYNEDGSLYVICLEELKENIKAIKSGIKMDDYYKMVEDTITSRAISKRFIQGRKFKNNGLSIKEGDYEVLTDLMGQEYHLMYRIAVVESKQYFFQLVLYAPYVDSCKVYDVMDTITKSFRLLDENKKNT